MINFEPNVTRSTFNGYKNSYFTKYFIEEPKQVYKSNKVKTANYRGFYFLPRFVLFLFGENREPASVQELKTYDDMKKALKNQGFFLLNAKMDVKPFLRRIMMLQAYLGYKKFHFREIFKKFRRRALAKVKVSSYARIK